MLTDVIIATTITTAATTMTIITTQGITIRADIAHFVFIVAIASIVGTIATNTIGMRASIIAAITATE